MIQYIWKLWVFQCAKSKRYFSDCLHLIWPIVTFWELQPLWWQTKACFFWDITFKFWANSCLVSQKRELALMVQISMGRFNTWTARYQLSFQRQSQRKPTILQFVCEPRGHRPNSFPHRVQKISLSWKSGIKASSSSQSCWKMNPILPPCVN